MLAGALHSTIDIYTCADKVLPKIAKKKVKQIVRCIFRRTHEQPSYCSDFTNIRHVGLCLCQREVSVIMVASVNQLTAKKFYTVSCLDVRVCILEEISGYYRVQCLDFTPTQTQLYLWSAKTTLIYYGYSRFPPSHPLALALPLSLALALPLTRSLLLFLSLWTELGYLLLQLIFVVVSMCYHLTEHTSCSGVLLTELNEWIWMFMY